MKHLLLTLTLALLLPGLAFGQTRTPVATDNFNRASLGANWTSLNPNWGDPTTTASTFLVGVTTDALGNEQAARWDGTGTFSNNQYSQLLIQNLDWLSSTYNIGVICRADSATNGSRDYYFLAIESSVNGPPFSAPTILGEVNNGTVTEHNRANVSWTDTSDTMGIDCDGTTIAGVKNGTRLGGAFTITDATLTTGKPGILITGSSSYPQGDNWEGGDIATAGAVKANPISGRGGSAAAPVVLGN